MINAIATDFSSWREAARKLIQANIMPRHVNWNDTEGQASFFAQGLPTNIINENNNVPAEFLELAEYICHHHSPERFSLLYQMLWRLVRVDKNLLKIESDPLTNRLEIMRKAIRRDVHKTKAFVRFKITHDENGLEHYIAWHKPDHYSLRLSAPFFKRRFSVMNWTILTPDESAWWDGKTLNFGPGAKVTDAPSDDHTEELWKEFYRAIFNPARVKIKAMKKEMPVRHWATLPEASIIPEMLAEVPERIKIMIEHNEGYARSANDFIPKDANLEELRSASIRCEGCPLYRNAAGTVFGVGPKDAKLVLVGEQPGNEEDINGIPFIGPAGQVLNRALIETGLDRSQIYLTNAVKHFKFTPTDGRLIHVSPSLQDIINCRPWLEAELEVIKPRLVMCLGVTAARSLINPRFKMEDRGKLITKNNIIFMPTYHPSAVLRGAEPEKIYNIIVEDLRNVREYLMQASML